MRSILNIGTKQGATRSPMQIFLAREAKPANAVRMLSQQGAAAAESLSHNAARLIRPGGTVISEAPMNVTVCVV
jgi:hypothetical protein